MQDEMCAKDSCLREQRLAKNDRCEPICANTCREVLMMSRALVSEERLDLEGGALCGLGGAARVVEHGLPANS